MKCHCGCGNDAPPEKRFIQGHNESVRKFEHGENFEKKAPATNYRKLLTDEQITYLRNHYRFIPRTKLAKRLGMDKRILNFVCIELELAREA